MNLKKGYDYIESMFAHLKNTIEKDESDKLK